jgi:ribosome-associated toxin RatA of RatAB toxin-antitoxin module
LIDSKDSVLNEIHKSAVVPYSAEAMYALVNDIAAYPEFLPWCRSTGVQNQNDTHLQATLTLEAGKIRQSFTTENTMQPGRMIEMRLVEGPFKYLNGCWRFEPLSPYSCNVRLDLRFEFKNKVLKLALGKAFKHIMGSLVDSFIQRAEVIHGKS